MTPGIKPLIAGNWKMHGLRASLTEIETTMAGIDEKISGRLEVLLCPPFTLLGSAVALTHGSNLKIGAQDCHSDVSGAYTGDISAEMIADSGALFAIVGHSERRANHCETDRDVSARARAAMQVGIVPIICIGETGQERENSQTLDVLRRQLDGSLPEKTGFVIAYEPVWAIGSGRVATQEDIVVAHAFIRSNLEARFGRDGRLTRLLYGGSVKPENAADILSAENVDGALVGGASLKAVDFLAICRACAEMCGPGDDR
jgi:triosephosphate isomerase (TIM)